MLNENTNKRLSKEHFDDLSKNYDQVYVDPSHGQHFEFTIRTQVASEELKRYLSNNLPYKKKFAFLDAACGTGQLTLELIKSASSFNADVQFYVNDFSEPMLLKAKSIIDADDKDISLSCDAIETFLEKNTKSYDMIFCLGLLAHVANPYELSVSLVERLNKGGVLVVQYTNHDNVFHKIESVYSFFKASFHGGHKIARTSHNEIKALFLNEKYRTVETSYLIGIPFLASISPTINNYIEKKLVWISKYIGREKILCVMLK